MAASQKSANVSYYHTAALTLSLTRWRAGTKKEEIQRWHNYQNNTQKISSAFRQQRVSAFPDISLLSDNGVHLRFNDIHLKSMNSIDTAAGAMNQEAKEKG